VPAPSASTTTAVSSLSQLRWRHLDPPPKPVPRVRAPLHHVETAQLLVVKRSARTEPFSREKVGRVGSTQGLEGTDR